MFLKEEQYLTELKINQFSVGATSEEKKNIEK